VAHILENIGGDTDFQLEKAEAIETRNDIIEVKP